MAIMATTECCLLRNVTIHGLLLLLWYGIENSEFCCCDASQMTKSMSKLQITFCSVVSNSILMPLLIHYSHVTVAMSVSTAVAADWLAASDIPQECMARRQESTRLVFIPWYVEDILCAPSQLHN